MLDGKLVLLHIFGRRPADLLVSLNLDNENAVALLDEQGGQCLSVEFCEQNQMVIRKTEKLPLHPPACVRCFVRSLPLSLYRSNSPLPPLLAPELIVHLPLFGPEARKLGGLKAQPINLRGGQVALKGGAVA